MDDLRVKVSTTLDTTKITNTRLSRDENIKKLELKLKANISLSDTAIKRFQTQINKLVSKSKVELSVNVRAIGAREAEKELLKASQAAQAAKSALGNIDNGATFEKVKAKISQLNEELKGISSEISDWSAILNSKTGEITGATVKIKDGFGRVREEIYQLTKEYEKFTDKAGKERVRVSGVDLDHTATKYSQNIGAQQEANFAKAKAELSAILSLEKKQSALTIQDVELNALINKQLKEHWLSYNEILDLKVIIDKSTSTNALTEEQLLSLLKQRLLVEEEISRLKTKANAPNATEEVVGLGHRANYDASADELKRYAEAVAGVGAEWTTVKPSINAAGDRIKEVGVRVKEGADKWRLYKMTINETTGSLVKVDKGLADATNRQISFKKSLGIAIKRLGQWGAATLLIYGSLRKISEGIKYISELDDAMNEVRIVTGLSQKAVDDLALSYNKLAKEMSVTTMEIAKTSADLYRQGLSGAEVDERMERIIKYAKISSITLDEANKIITSSANATGVSATKITDIYAMLGDTTASGKNVPHYRVIYNCKIGLFGKTPEMDNSEEFFNFKIICQN